jgi:hypothetical protein
VRCSVLALAALALAGPADAMRYTGPVSVNLIDLRDHNPGGPSFPGDLLVCTEGDAPGEDCNCVHGEEDTCTPIAWTSCGTDMDCEIKSRSPYGFKPRRD